MCIRDSANLVLAAVALADRARKVVILSLIHIFQWQNVPVLIVIIQIDEGTGRVDISDVNADTGLRRESVVLGEVEKYSLRVCRRGLSLIHIY